MTKLEELFIERNAVKSKLDQVKERMSSIDEKISELVGGEFNASRKAQDKHFGALTINIDGVDVKQTVPKTVKWDQDRLSEIEAELAKSGIDPNGFITVKRSVSEATFNKMNRDQRDYFSDARTEKAGSPKIELLEKK